MNSMLRGPPRYIYIYMCVCVCEYEAVTVLPIYHARESIFWKKVCDKKTEEVSEYSPSKRIYDKSEEDEG